MWNCACHGWKPGANPLSRLDAVIDWESFRRTVESVLTKSGKGLVVQPYYNFWDEQMNRQSLA